MFILQKTFSGKSVFMIIEPKTREYYNMNDKKNEMDEVKPTDWLIFSSVVDGLLSSRNNL